MTKQERIIAAINTLRVQDRNPNDAEAQALVMACALELAQVVVEAMASMADSLAVLAGDVKGRSPLSNPHDGL